MSSPDTESPKTTVVVVAGPTASGKSALALDFAEAIGGAVINADSMQVYRDLRILTARPSPAEEGRVPHRLFGVLPGSQRGSAVWWRDAALREIDAAAASGWVPILCGGTGLYLRSLMAGIADVPEIQEAVLQEAERRYRAIGAAAFHAEVSALDPEIARRLEVGDSQRLQRAWSVARATGKPLSAWQARTPEVRPDLAFRSILLMPPRPASADAIARRFRAMVEAGAVEEVRRLVALDLDPSLPVMRAIGVLQIVEFIEKKTDLEGAVERAVIATRQYAKRQRTWFRHQFVSEMTIGAQYSQSSFSEIFAKIRSCLLTPES